MADSFIVVTTEGLDEIIKKLDKLSPAIADEGIQAANEDAVKYLKTYDVKYRYVSRKAAYGSTFVSEKQRRWFFAALRSGELEIPYKRTGALRRAWRVVGAGRTGFIANDRPGAGFVMGDIQSRHEGLVGWKKVEEVLQKRINQLLKAFSKGVDKAIKRVGLS